MEDLLLTIQPSPLIGVSVENLDATFIGETTVAYETGKVYAICIQRFREPHEERYQVYKDLSNSDVERGHKVYPNYNAIKQDFLWQKEPK